MGVRKGTLTADIEGGAVRGTLNIMDRENTFEGTVCENGSCRIRGTLQTLLHTLRYEGSGELNEQKASLTLDTGKYRLQLNGER